MSVFLQGTESSSSLFIYFFSFFFFWEEGINNFNFAKPLPIGLFQGFPAYTKLDFHVRRISEEAKLNFTTEWKNEGDLRNTE